jgi:DNA-binding beta-propeller fold protein YncE
MKILQSNKIRMAGLAVALCLAAGCATPTKTAKTYYFFPSPPDEPRFQFLTSFSSEKEFRGGEDKSLMTFLTGEQPPDRSFGKPYGAAAGNKKIYVCDTDLHAVLVVDLQTKHIQMLDAQGEGALNQPLNISVDADGNLYVADVGRNQVIIFDKDGGYVATLGKQGEMKPRDAVASQDRIYVADLQNHDVHVFDKKTRSLLFDIPRPEDATNQLHALFTPTNLALDSKGRLYVSDSGAFHVQLYDNDGTFLRSVGGIGDSTGQFARVKGVAVDRDDRLYAVDALSQVTQVFDDQGRLLTWFAQPGSAGLVQNLPSKVVVDYDDVDFFQSYAAPNFKVEHLVIVINQIGPNKVSIFGFGHKK